MFLNDIYIRTGQFTNCIKKYLYDNKYLIAKKYIEANTFSRNLKLGFTLKSLNAHKRNVSYIKFVDSLDALKNIINGNMTCVNSLASSRASSRVNSCMSTPRKMKLDANAVSYKLMAEVSNRLLPLAEEEHHENENMVPVTQNTIVVLPTENIMQLSTLRPELTRTISSSSVTSQNTSASQHTQKIQPTFMTASTATVSSHPVSPSTTASMVISGADPNTLDSSAVAAVVTMNMSPSPR